MDILLSAANAALLLAHDIRRDAEADLLLLGPPDPPRLVRILGSRVRAYQPDLRSNAALLRKALEHGSRVEREVSPGILASKASLPEALDRLGAPYVYLKEGGPDIRAIPVPPDATFVLSDNQDLTADEDQLVRGLEPLVVGLGPHSLHADQAIVLVQNELDRMGT